MKKILTLTAILLIVIPMLLILAPTAQAPTYETSTPEEVLKIKMLEDVTLLENGTSKLVISIDIPSVALAELYRESLGIPQDCAVGEELPIPENMTLPGSNMTISIREEFYTQIEQQQQLSLGLRANISDSVIVPRTNFNGCRIWISATSSVPVDNITQVGRYNLWKIGFGPMDDNSTKATMGFIFTTIEFAQLMLEALAGPQIYELHWSTRIKLPKDSTLLNSDEIDGLDWKMDFGGGTVVDATLSIDETSNVVLDERTIITEKSITTSAEDLYEAITHYKVFTLEYLLPHSSQIYEKIKKSINSDDWSKDWDHTWEGERTETFEYHDEHVDIVATLDVRFTVALSVHVAWDLSLTSPLTMFESWMQLEATAELDFEAIATASYTNTWTHKFFELTPPPRFTFWVGPVLVWADLHFTATGTLALSAYGEVQVHAGVTVHGLFRAGARWTQESGWSDIWEIDRDVSHYGPTIEAEASLWMRAGLNCRLEFLFYGVAGPFIEFEPYVTVTVTFDYPPPELYWLITLNLRIRAGATFAGWLQDLLGLHDYYWEWDWELMRWEGFWSPSSISITETLDPSTSLPSGPVRVYGTATFDDGSPVSYTDVIVTITQTGASWTTTTDANGYYSAYISAPETADTYNVHVSITTGSSSAPLTGSNSRSLVVQYIPDGGTDYGDVETTTCKDVMSEHPWDPIDETEVFRSDDFIAYVWVRIYDIYTELDVRWDFYYPDGSYYWGIEKNIPDPASEGYTKWLRYTKASGIYIDGYLPEDMEGRWRCEVHVDEGSGYELVAIEEFVIRYETISAYRTMAKDVQGGVPDGTYPYEPVDPTNKFLNTDPRALGWIRLDALAESVEVIWKWRDPSGNIDFTSDPYTTEDPADEGYFYYTWYKFWGWINIYGTSRQSKIGTWEMEMYVKDVYGNWDFEYSEYFTISDNTHPGAPGTPVDDGIYSTTGSVTWTWTEAYEDGTIAEYQMQVGTTPSGNDVFDGSVGLDLTKTLDGLPSGRTYYARVRAKNTVGQWGPWSGVSDGITVDRPPATIITGGPSGNIDYDDVLFTWIGSDDLTPTSSLVYSYYLEGYDTGWSSWTLSMSKQYNDLPVGDYIFKVRSRDQIGNIDLTPAERSFAVVLEGWVPYVPTPEQTDVEISTTSGITYAKVTLTFPDAGYQITDWGTVSRIDNAFSADATVERWTGFSTPVLTVLSHTYELGHLDADTYTFAFMAWGTHVRTEQFTIEEVITHNLIKNPGFEDGLEWWSVSEGTATYTADSTDPRFGVYCARGEEFNEGSLGRLYQDVTALVTPGKQYKISGWIKTEGVVGYAVIALNYVANNGWSPADGYVKEIGYVTGTSDWTYFESEIFMLPSMPADCVAAWFLFDFNAGKGVAWWDDVQLIEVTGYAFLFDERRAGTDTLDYEYSEIAEILQQQGHLVDSTTDLLTGSLLSDFDILVITCPHGSYSTTELEAIESFVQDGGGLLLMGQWSISDPTGINQVAGLFGVSFIGTGAVRDPDMGVDEFMPIITQFDYGHPVSTTISSIGIYGGRVLSIGSNTPLAWGDANTYGDLNNNGQYDAGEPIGSDAVVMAAAQLGSGKAVFISDTDLFDNDFLQDHDNQKLFFNVINWLIELYPLPTGAKHWVPSDPKLDDTKLLIDVNIEGQGQTAYVYAGETVSGTCTYQMWAPHNPNEINQGFFIMSWTPSWPAPDGYYVPIWNGISGLYPGTGEAMESFSFTAPTTPGTYYLYWCRQAHYTMRQAVDTYDQPLNLPAHAKIVVTEAVLRITADSPVNIRVTDLNGLQVGYDPVSGTIIEILGATYSGPGTEPQEITIPNPAVGTYRVDAFGTGTGAYTITMESFASDGALVDSEVWTGIAEPGEQYTQEVELEPNGDITDSTPPTTTGTTVTPTPTTDNPILTATVTDALSTVVAAEYFIDATGADGTGTSLSAVDGVFEELSEEVTAIISISALIQGEHTVYVHGKDSANNWGDFDSYLFIVVKTYSLTVEASPLDASGGAFLATYTLNEVTYIDEEHTTPWTTEADVGTTVAINSPQEIIDKVPDDRTRYAYASGAGTYTMDSDKTITLVYQIQYYITVNNGGHGTASGEEWYDSGVSATFSISPTIVYEGDGTRYVFTQWSGDSTSTNPTDTILMDGPKTVTANWKTQYQVTFEQTGCGATTYVTYLADTDPIEAVPFSIWAKAGSTLTFSYDEMVNDGQPTRYVLVNVDHTSPLTVNVPITITATYKTQHYLTVEHSPIDPILDGHQTGQDYYDADSIATVTADLHVDIVTGESRYEFDHWSGDASGTSTTTTIIMSAPKTATANYKIQYHITVTSAHDSPTPSAWVDAGSDFTASVDSPADIEPDLHRWVCSGFSVDGGDLQEGTSYTFFDVQAPHTIVFYWWQQFWVTLTYTGDTTGQFSDPASVSASLTVTETGQPLQDKITTFTIGIQSASATTNEQGIAATTITLNQLASDPGVTVEFAGDSVYLQRSVSEPFTILKEDAVLEYTGSLEGQYSDVTTLSAKLIDQDSGVGIAGKTVTFTIGTQTASAVTGADGVAATTITLTQPPVSYAVTTSFDGDGYYYPSLDSVAFTITKEDTTIIYVGATCGQYSDSVTLSAKLVDEDSGVGIECKTIIFTFGTPILPPPHTDSEGIATASTILDQPAGEYPVLVTFEGDDYYIGSSVVQSFTILKEDAKVDYTGDTVVPTTARTINLRATVFDSPDGSWGDLTKMQVTFSIYVGQLGPSNLYPTKPTVPVSPTETPGVGVATVAIDNLPENGYLIIVKIDDNNYYCGPTSDATALTVYEPTGEFVTGGGWIWDPTGSKGNFGFNARYTKSGRPKGHSLYVYREGRWNYIVKSNAWIGLAIEEGHAYFEAKCVVQKYNPETEELVWAEGNYKFRVDAWDNDSDGGVDIYQIRVLDKDGVLFHEAGFDPFGELQGGNIVIHDEKKKH